MSERIVRNEVPSASNPRHLTVTVWHDECFAEEYPVWAEWHDGLEWIEQPNWLDVYQNDPARMCEVCGADVRGEVA